jgi:hypothetical protein
VEWIRVLVPELAVIPEALWTAAHRQMAAQRERYSRTNARGAPPWGTEGKHLLTGLLRCAVCGSGMEARSRSHGHQRVVFYGCAAYHRRGTTVCRNELTAPMGNADSAILSALETALLHPKVLKAAVRRATEQLARQGESRPAVDAELRKVAQELERLTGVLVAGGDLPALLAALQERDPRRRELVAR